jgi:hypothetical protein
LMVEYNLGVTTKSIYELKSIYQDFFEEEVWFHGFRESKGMAIGVLSVSLSRLLGFGVSFLATIFDFRNCFSIYKNLSIDMPFQVWSGINKISNF